MCRFLYFAVLVALCLAVNCSAEEKKPVAVPAKPKTKQTLAREKYSKAKADSAKLYTAVTELKKQCEEAEAAKHSAEGSAPLVGINVDKAKKFVDKYPKSKNMKKIYKTVEQFPENAKNLMAVAEAKVKEVCQIMEEVDKRHDDVTNEEKKMTAVFPLRNNVTNANADNVTIIADSVIDLAQKAAAFFNSTMRKSHPIFSTAVVASHTVEELQHDTEAALFFLERAVKNLKSNGEDKSEIPAVVFPKPGDKDKPQANQSSTVSPVTAPATSSGTAPTTPTLHDDEKKAGESAAGETEKEEEKKSSTETPESPEKQPSDVPVVSNPPKIDLSNTTSDAAKAWSSNIIVVSVPLLLFALFPF